MWRGFVKSTFYLNRTSQPRRSRNASKMGVQPYPGEVIEASKLDGAVKSENLIFYTHVLCPFAERVWLCILQKQVKHTLVHIDLSDKPHWFLSMNPRGLVPCVAYEDEVITESEDICRWINATFAGDDLLAQESNGIELLHSWSVCSSCLEIIAAERKAHWTIGSKVSPQELARFLEQLDEINAAASLSWGPFLNGELPGIHDFLLWPFVSRAVLALRACSYAINSEQISGDSFAWAYRMMKDPTVQLITPDEDLIVKKWKKVKRLDWFDYETTDVEQFHPQVMLRRQHDL